MPRPKKIAPPTDAASARAALGLALSQGKRHEARGWAALLESYERSDKAIADAAANALKEQEIKTSQQLTDEWRAGESLRIRQEIAEEMKTQQMLADFQRLEKSSENELLKENERLKKEVESLRAQVENLKAAPAIEAKPAAPDPATKARIAEALGIIATAETELRAEIDALDGNTSFVPALANKITLMKTSLQVGKIRSALERA